MNPCTLHVVIFPVAHIIPLSGGMNKGVKTHTVLEKKSLIEMPRTNLCCGLDLLKELRVTCDMIMSEPIAEKRHVILWRANSAISYFSFIVERVDCAMRTITQQVIISCNVAAGRSTLQRTGFDWLTTNCSL